MTSIATLAVLLSTLTPPQREKAEFQIFATAVAQVESGMNFKAIGDRGNAKGCFQMHIASWICANQWRQKNGLPTIKREDWKNEDNQKQMGFAYLMWCKEKLIEGGLKNPSWQEIYVAFGWGYSNFKDVGFDMSKVPQAKRDAAERVDNIVKELLK